LKVEAFKADDTGKIVWIIHIPQHEPRLPVYAHGKPWQRLGDSLVPMRQERLTAILTNHLNWPTGPQSLSPRQPQATWTQKPY
jgi:ATP-dependent DNA helicase RecG